MNVLFLTMTHGIRYIEASGIYTDLMRKFRDEGHNVYIMYPLERRMKKSTEIIDINGVHYIGIRTLNLTKTNIIEKGLGQVLLEYQFNRNLKKFWKNIAFDLVLYSTPPITFTTVIKAVKKRNPNALSYLLLKDIFPQNAVDMGMLSINGVRGLLYKYFRNKEKELYKISDYIGCMSPANVNYIIRHNPEVNPQIIEIAPNSYDVVCVKEGSKESHDAIKKKYGLPINRPIFIYGGNMGKPQGIPFLIDCMKAIKDRTDCHFIIVGNGTEYSKILSWINLEKPKSVSLYQRIPKQDYDNLAKACDVGLIFLDYRFTIPNYPSRLLPYLMLQKPIIAITDRNCDTGTIAEDNGYGFWCPSNSVEQFVKTIDKMLSSNMNEMGKKGYEFYLNNYTVNHTYQAIIKHKL